MEKAQYAILRFAKYKGPEIGRIEAHNERTKEVYASNPDVDTSRSKLNFHLVQPQRRYRAECEKQIAEAGCRTRSDSVRMVEALITASPEFFKGKSRAEIKAFFETAKAFIEQEQNPKTIISVVVHMDEKTPHMHLVFVPLTADNRLCAKEILGNRKKLTQWQDKFWAYMVEKFPALERGENASETGRDHIPPRVFKQMTRLTKQKLRLDELLDGITPFNARSRYDEIARILDKFIPGMAQMDTTLKKCRKAFSETTAENRQLRDENADLSKQLEAAGKTSVLKQLEDAQLHREYAAAKAVLERIPPEIINAYAQSPRREKTVKRNNELE